MYREISQIGQLLCHFESAIVGGVEGCHNCLYVLWFEGDLVSLNMLEECLSGQVWFKQIFVVIEVCNEGLKCLYKRIYNH